MNNTTQNKDNTAPWKDMAGLRDMVAHQYFHLDLPSIWTSATEDIADVEKEINKYLAQ